MPRVVLVTPALADANNGNWRHAQRWRRLLRPRCAVRLVARWRPGDPEADLMIALHAGRSAPSIHAWAATHPERGLAVALTGTDLYRDIRSDPAARRSLELAHRLVVLQPLGRLALPARLRARAEVIYPSTSARAPLAKTRRHLRAVVVGHLRAEKSPRTVFDAVRLIPAGAGIRIDHLGAALEPALGRAARALTASHPHYRWLGEVPAARARRHIQRAHLLLHPSAIEGGAHVVMEAVRSGTPVLASRIDGNLGMLGADYAGYFTPGRADQLAALLARCATEVRGEERGEQRSGSPPRLLERLARQIGRRAPCFDPQREQRALWRLVAALCAGGPRGADRRGADRRGADPHGADRRGADPRGADSRRADPRRADGRGARRRGADRR